MIFTYTPPPPFAQKLAIGFAIVAFLYAIWLMVPKGPTRKE
jgi:hypothetical protein